MSEVKEFDIKDGCCNMARKLKITENEKYTI